jgi:hypothetical protein
LAAWITERNAPVTPRQRGVPFCLVINTPLQKRNGTIFFYAVELIYSTL